MGGNGVGTVGAFRDRLEAVRERIERAARRAGRRPDGITMVVVTKAVPVDRLREAVACGCRIFGESRVQEALTKMEALEAASIEWHLIGPVQTNKVKNVIGRFALLHAVDRLEVAERLDRTARERGVVQPVLLEVNVGGEATKHGFAPDDLLAAAERMSGLPAIRVTGLMTIPPAAADPETSRPYFRRLRELAEKVDAQKIAGVSMQELSMGMSGDFEQAVEEGATMVRLGTALFGPRTEGRA